MQGIQGAVSSSGEVEQGKIPEKYILMCKGPFCTPRSVIKNMTIKARPKLEEIADCMKLLSEKEIGEFKQLTQKERAYYKPLPEEDNKESINLIIGSGKWEDYVRNFKTVDMQYITSTQHNRLLLQSPHLEVMEDYGITDRIHNTD